MIFASSPDPVFKKKDVSVPSGSFDTILDVDAELHPPPPAGDTVVFDASRPSSFTTEASSFIVEG